MTFDEVISAFSPGKVARRSTWARQYSLQMKEGDQVRLHDTRDPSFNPVWRKCGYDAEATDYFFEVRFDGVWLLRQNSEVTHEKREELLGIYNNPYWRSHRDLFLSHRSDPNPIPREDPVERLVTQIKSALGLEVSIGVRPSVTGVMLVVDDRGVVKEYTPSEAYRIFIEKG